MLVRTRSAWLSPLASVLAVLVILFSTAGVALADASPSATHAYALPGLPPGRMIHASRCDQPPPQSVRDRATYSPAELARYGLPPRSPGEPFARWALAVRSATKRYCDMDVAFGHTGSDTWYNTSWSGYFGDQSGGSQAYSAADVDWWAVNTADNASEAEASWVGLGGNNNNYLIQAGSWLTRVYVPGAGWVSQCQAWVENTAFDNTAHFVFTIGCGDHMYANVWAPNNMFVEDLDTGASSLQTYGPAASNQTAEAMIERPITNGQQLPLANFGSETFHGVGVADNGSYDAIACVPGYLMSCVPNSSFGAMLLYNSTQYTYQLTALGAIQYQGNDSPNDQYSITFQQAS